MPADQPNVWNDDLLNNPHAVADKRLRVRKMFAAIAPSYDINNRIHSVWQDQRWRRKAVKLAELKPTDTVVDVACGTGDLAIKFRDALFQNSNLKSQISNKRLEISNHKFEISHSVFSFRILGIDFTFPMLPIARSKSGGDQIAYINADALALPLPDACADVVSIAFGIRNVQDPAAALREFHRILRPGGRVIILEFSLPTNPLLRGLYNFYFRRILPRTATWISRDRTGAYKYLPESVNTFIDRQTMLDLMSSAGFDEVQQFPLTFGVCICYRGVKRTES